MTCPICDNTDFYEDVTDGRTYECPICGDQMLSGESQAAKVFDVLMQHGRILLPKQIFEAGWQAAIQWKEMDP